MQRVGGVRGPARLHGADRARAPSGRACSGTGWRLTGELAGADALYASVLPRAIETAELLAPALVADAADGDRAKPPSRCTECGLCELHPGRGRRPQLGRVHRAVRRPWTGTPTPTSPSPPAARAGPASSTGWPARWTSLAAGHPGQLVVVACHAGVIEASLLAKLPVAGGLDGARLQLRTRHASLTTWEVDGGRWRLLGYNDASHLAVLDRPAEAGSTAGAGRRQQA